MRARSRLNLSSPSSCGLGPQSEPRPKAEGAAVGRLTRGSEGGGRILIVKLGALGNVVLSFGPFEAIRRHHADAHITLLTTTPYAAWLARAPWFDDVWIDERPEWWDLSGLLRLRRRLVEGQFDRAYDLQTSGRSSRYFQLLPHGSRPEWSGIAHGCALPDRDPNRNRLHDVDRQFGQLRQAGIKLRPPADLSWSNADISHFGLPVPYALLAPGSSPHRLLKRWPATHFAELAAMLLERGLTPVVVGTAPEQTLAETIRQAVPETMDLTGQTDFDQIVSLGRGARVAIGNDTGPMHLISATNCASVVLFSRDSDPKLCAPRGQSVRVLQSADLRDLEATSVRDAAMTMISHAAGALYA
jgi:ADP-heptose:LPS heptosyltransferase